MIDYLNSLWQKLNSVQQKTLKIMGVFSLLLFVFYWTKVLIIQYFIHQFLNKPPVISLSRAEIHPKQSYYHTVGQLKAKRNTTLSVESPGIVQKILVKPGQYVKKNQAILKLNNQIETAKLRIQKADLILAERLFSQQSDLFQKNNISKTQYLEAKTRLKKAKAQYQEAQAQLKHKTVYAPFSGVIGIPEVERGDYVNPGQKALMSLQQSQKLYLDFYLPEHYYSAIHLKDVIQFQLNQSDKKSYPAQITAIQPSSEQMAHSIWIRATINNPNGQWIPGLSVHVTVRTDFQPKAIFIPSRCLLGSSQGPIVYTAQRKMNSKTHHPDWWIKQHQVKIGMSSQHQTEILSGLNGNEYLVSSGTQKVQDQTFVKVKLIERP